jgi:hypothetical protein
MDAVGAPVSNYLTPAVLLLLHDYHASLVGLGYAGGVVISVYHTNVRRATDNAIALPEKSKYVRAACHVFQNASNTPRIRSTLLP